MNAIEQTALNYLTKRGYRVFPPYAVAEPGTTWRPTRGDIRDTRTVKAVGEDGVTYVGLSGPPHTITRQSWGQWVQKRRAVQVTL